MSSHFSARDAALHLSASPPVCFRSPPRQSLISAIRRHVRRHHRDPLALAPPASVTRHPPTAPVDVIVPVYRGLEETRACLESVWRATPRQPFRLVVINDASPEPALTAWLREAATDPATPMTLLESPINRGFVGTVNLGMTLSDTADVVLLNSDTQVANDWLDRLAGAAYAPGDRPVATVTPFSNNATICSYPRFCEDNPLPFPHDAASLDRLMAETHPGQHVEIPTGVGFCLYIRRACLASIGLFDEASFGQGYGEENDFCMRALKHGWRNLHALDVFVQHKGKVSFGESHTPRLAAALETLDRLHPDYTSLIHRYIQRDPARQARRALDLARLRNDTRPLILLVSHSRAGGVKQHCLELRDTLRTQAQFLLLRPAEGGYVCLSWLNDTEEGRLWYRLPSEYDALVDLLRSAGVDLVHYQHILGHHPRIRDLAVSLDVPQDVTLHDYYLLCPSITLTGPDGRYRDEPGRHLSPPAGYPSLASWRTANHTWLSQSRHVLAPSRDTADRFLHHLPPLPIRAVAHPDSETHSQTGKPVFVPPVPGEPLKVAVLGALSKEKGADLLESVARIAHERQHNIQFRLFGYAYRKLDSLSSLSVTGQYAPEDLPAMLRDWQPHLVWFPAQWPETYSYTLSTCLALELPVVAPRLGAFPERLAGRSASWLRPVTTQPHEWIPWFQSLVTSPRRLPLPETTAADSPAFYRNAYLALQRAPGDQSAPFAPDAHHLHDPRQRQCTSRLRQALVTALYRLRQHPWLAPLMRHVPTTFQRRIKCLVLGERD